MIPFPLVSRIKNALAPAKIKISIIVIVSLIALFLIIQSLSSLYTLRRIEWRNNHMLEQPHTVAVEDIQGWMTFEYLNVVFKLPPEYLRETLSIESPKYPRVTLRRYAGQNKISLPVLIQNVQEAITQYR